MTPTDILTPVIIGLAFYGFIKCLAERLWVTLLMTTALALVIQRINPFTPDQALAWLGAALLVLVGIIAALLDRPDSQAAIAKPAKHPAKGQKEIVIDGTNVMYWDGNEPALATLRGVVDTLTKRGFHPYVFLDASSRHHLKDKSLSEKKFATVLGLHASRVMVCPAGTEADVFILKFAKSQSLSIVSNDRFGDRAQQAKGIKLVKGVFANGKPILEGP